MGNVFEECPEDAAAAGLRSHVDALNPPKPAVAPIAPFGGNHNLPNHTFGISTGAGADFVVLDGDPTRDGNDTFTVALGDGNDVAQVAGANLDSTDSVNLDGGKYFDSLLYDSAGHALTPSTPTFPGGRVALVGLTRATVNYTNFEVLPPDPHGFDGDNDGIGCET